MLRMIKECHFEHLVCVIGSLSGFDVRGPALYCIISVVFTRRINNMYCLCGRIGLCVAAVILKSFSREGGKDSRADRNNRNSDSRKDGRSGLYGSTCGTV